MRLPPLYVYLSWPRPNYVDPITRSAALLATNGVFVGVMLLTVAARFYSRIKSKKWYRTDDCFIAIATIFAVALCVVVLIGNKMYCWDRHTWDVPFNKIEGAMIVAFVAKIAFTFAATATRVSLLCLYYRLVQDSGIQWFRWALHVTMAYVVAICVLFVFLVIFGCVPVEAYWEFPPSSSAKCLDEGTITVTSGILNCISDFIVASLPIPIVMKLRMPLKQRIGVCTLLSLGYVVTVAGIVRTYFIYQSLVATYDETWYSYPLWIAATVEIDLAVICACAPAIHKLVKRNVSELSSKLSKKLSSLKSPSTSRNTPTSSEPSTQPSKKSSNANRVHTDSVLYSATGEKDQITTTADETSPKALHQPDSVLEGDIYEDSKEWEKQAAHDNEVKSVGPSHPALKILKTSTFEQASLHDGERYSLPVELRDQWLRFHRKS